MDLTTRLAELFRFHKLNYEDVDDVLANRGSCKTCCICTRDLDPTLDYIYDQDGKHIPHPERAVVEHDHWTGTFRGFAHNECNLLVRQQRRLFPVVFHNFRGYDAHILLKHAHLLNLTKERLFIGCIPTTMEKYLSVSLKWQVSEWIPDPKNPTKVVKLYNEIRFIDSMQFLSRGLSDLIDTLARGCKTPADSSRLFSNVERTLAAQYKEKDLFALARRKQVFPHSYITSEAILEEESLPPIEEFKLGLNSKKELPEEDYKHAQDAWTELGCKKLWDYSKFYLVIDVAGLADVFEKFRRDSYEAYGMDPVMFYSLPGFAWAAMFRKTKVEVDLLREYEMFAFYEQSIRGGLVQLTKHYQKADNVYTNPENHENENDFSRYLFLFDANALYSWAMTQPLPTGNHRWIMEAERLEKMFPADRLGDWPNKTGDTGYTLMVDLDCPWWLMAETESLPLAPTRETLMPDKYSLLMLKQFRDCNPEKGKIRAEQKLMATQTRKEKYIVHFRILHFYLCMGMKLLKIHCAVAFDQSPFMASYINFNIAKRIEEAGDPGKSDFYKLLNNAVFGKTQEQQRKHMNLALEVDPERQQLLIGRDNYMGSVVFTDTLAGIFQRRKKTMLKHPIYIGSTILDHSKLLMYYFFYKVIRPRFGIVSVMYMDTDSFLLDIKDENVMRKLESLKNVWIDGSKMPEDHPLHTKDVAGQLGKFKEELCGIPITEVVALRPKMYCIKSLKEEKKTAKGINKCVVKEEYRFAQYKEVYERSLLDEPWKSGEVMHTEQHNFRSQRHEVQLIRQKKKSLTIADSKRYWISPNESLPFGHARAEHDLKKTLEEREKYAMDTFKCSLAEMSRKPMKQRTPYKRPCELAIKERVIDDDEPSTSKRRQDEVINDISLYDDDEAHSSCPFVFS